MSDVKRGQLWLDTNSWAGRFPGDKTFVFVLGPFYNDDVNDPGARVVEYSYKPGAEPLFFDIRCGYLTDHCELVCDA